MLPRVLSSICSVPGPIPAPPRRPSRNLRTRFHQIVASWLSFDSSLSIMKSRPSDINGFKPHRPPASRRSSSSRMPVEMQRVDPSSRLCRFARPEIPSLLDWSLPGLASSSKGTALPSSLVAKLVVLALQTSTWVDHDLARLLLDGDQTSHSVHQNCRVSALECPICDTSPNRLRVLATSAPTPRLSIRSPRGSASRSI